MFNRNVKSITTQNAIRPISDLTTYDKYINQGKKVIYLTFADGPSDIITNKVLGLLKENDAKATFFLIGNQIDGLEDVVKRIHSEGHSIGLHTYTHKEMKKVLMELSLIVELILVKSLFVKE